MADLVPHSAGALKTPFWEKKLDYLEGKENGIRNLFLFIAGLFGLTWLWNNHESVVDFLTDIERMVTLVTQNVIEVAIGAVIAYFIYQIIASPRTWRLLAMIADGLVRAIEKRYRSGGNAVNAAFFDLELLKRKVKKFLNAETVIRGIYNSTKESADRVKRELDGILSKVRAMDKDFQTRQAQMSSQEAAVLNAQLSGKKREAVSKATLLQSLVKRMMGQGRRLSQLEVYRELMNANIEAGEAELNNLVEELQSAESDAIAMQAADAVIGSVGESQFADQLQTIRGKISRYRAISDQIEMALQPDAARFITDKRLEVLTTDETFERMMADLGATRLDVQKALNPADESLAVYNTLIAEALPGNTSAERQAVAVQRDVRSMLH